MGILNTIICTLHLSQDVFFSVTLRSDREQALQGTIPTHHGEISTDIDISVASCLGASGYISTHHQHQTRIR